MPAGDLTTVAQWTPDNTIASLHIDNTTPEVGDTLNAVITMGDGNAAGSRVTYLWKVETVTNGTYGNFTDTGNATASYTVADEDKGKRLQVVVTGVSPITGSRTVTTDAVSIPITAITINNSSPALGDTLTANVTMGDSIVAGSRVTYQWEVETAATSGAYTNATGAGSTTTNYTITPADVGKRLRVVVKYMGRAASAETSAPTSAVVRPLPEWISSATALDLENATVTVVSTTEVSISGASLTGDWIIPAGKKLNLSNTALNEHTLSLAGVTVDSAGATLNLSDSILEGYIDVQTGATLNASNTTLDGIAYAWNIAEGATLNVSGTLTLANATAQLIVSGTSLISSSATVINKGTIMVNQNTGVLTNNGTITNNNMISIEGMMTNNGTIMITAEASITNFGTITNFGIITNGGTIINSTSAILNNKVGSSFTGNAPTTQSTP